MTDWALPSLVSTYTNFLTEVASRDTSCATWFNSATNTDVNLTVGTVRWNSTNNNWEKWSGTVWGVLTTTYGISITGYSNSLVGGNNTTLLGAIPYQSNVNTSTLLSPNTTTTKKFLTQTGTGTNGAAPVWGTIGVADVTGAAPIASPAFTTQITIGSSLLKPVTSGYGTIILDGSVNGWTGIEYKTGATNIGTFMAQSGNVHGWYNANNTAWSWSCTDAGAFQATTSLNAPYIYTPGNTSNYSMYVASTTYPALYVTSTLSSAIVAYTTQSSSSCITGTSYTGVGVVGVGGIGSYDFYAGGSGINYGPFTGGHDGVAPLNFTCLVGDILCDKEIVAHKNISNTIALVKVSTDMKDKTAIGVFVNMSPITSYNVPAALTLNNAELHSNPKIEAVYIEPLTVLQNKWVRVGFNAVGEGMINVCKEGGDISTGDYIHTSNTAGKGMKQIDDIARNYTVARARESASWTKGDNSIKQIACIYLCG